MKRGKKQRRRGIDAPRVAVLASELAQGGELGEALRKARVSLNQAAGALEGKKGCAAMRDARKLVVRQRYMRGEITRGAMEELCRQTDEDCAEQVRAISERSAKACGGGAAEGVVPSEEVPLSEEELRLAKEEMMRE